MNRQNDYDKFRLEYPNFIYKSYFWEEQTDKIIINYNYEIKNLINFNHKIEIIKENINYDLNNKNMIDNLVFNLGLVELVSYWKCTCSPNVIIECGEIDSEQVTWFKKLYFNGLGEMFYVNGITVDIDAFMNIICKGEKIDFTNENKELNDYLIPIGGGKDSCVTLETLKSDNNYALIVNPKEVTLKCAEVANIKKVIKVKRVIDKNLIELNNQNYLNGHTPFSAMIAFLSTIVAYISNKKYIALSNESSANESNVFGTNINHQYSKTIEFENDFRYYSSKFLKTNTEYFSFLRPILEIQIAFLFSKLKKYHQIFKSCNVGSKQEPWHWCCNCSKCLFVYIILSPFLSKSDIIDIFGEDLYDNKDLEEVFIELLGYGKNKPFDCVGTYDEVKYAVQKCIKQNEDNLPYLLKLYKDKYFNNEIDELLEFFSENNNLNEEQLRLLKEVLNDK